MMTDKRVHYSQLEARKQKALDVVVFVDALLFCDCEHVSNAVATEVVIPLAHCLASTVLSRSSLHVPRPSCNCSSHIVALSPIEDPISLTLSTCPMETQLTTDIFLYRRSNEFLQTYLSILVVIHIFHHFFQLFFRDRITNLSSTLSKLFFVDITIFICINRLF